MNTIERKQRTANAFAMLKTAGSAVALDFVNVVTEFWTVDKRNTHMLTNWLEQAKRYPRIQAAARKLMPQYCGVVISGSSKKGFTVANIENLSAKQKAKAKLNCGKLAELQLTSLLNHPDIKVTVEKVWVKEQETTKLRKQITSMLEHGMSAAELFNLVDIVLSSEAKKVKDNVTDIKAA